MLKLRIQEMTNFFKYYNDVIFKKDEEITQLKEGIDASQIFI